MAKMTVTATNLGETTIVSKVGGHTVITDIPEEVGGGGYGPTPGQLFLTSLAHCFALVVALHCRRRGINYDGMKVTVTADKVSEKGQGTRFTNLHLTLELPEELPPERLRALLRHGSIACTVKGTICGEQEVGVCIKAGENEVEAVAH